MFYNFTRIFRPDPGAQAYVFGTAFALPRFRILGAGVPAGGYFRPHQPPQVYQRQAVPTSGLGGLIVGGIAFQPLSDKPGK